MDIADFELEIEGYYFKRCDSHSRHTGGTMIYIRSDIVCEEIFNDTSCTKLSWMCTIKISRGFKKGIYSVLYKSPRENNTEFLSFMEKWCEECLELDTFCFLTGDFNLNVKNPDTCCKNLINLCKDNDLFQFVKDPTREDINCSSIIDLVFSNNHDLNIKVSNNDNISDHNIIFIDIPFIKTKSSEKYEFVNRVNWKNYSKDNLNSNLNKQNWDNFKKANSIQEKSKIIIDFLKNSISNLITFEKIKVKKNSLPFYNSHLKYLKRRKINARKYFNAAKSEDNLKLYKSARNLYKNNLRDTENNYIQDKIFKNQKNPKKLWKLLKKLYKGKSKKIENVKFNDEVISDPPVIAEKFNNFFVESIEKICENFTAGNNEYLNQIKEIANKCTFRTVDKNEIETILDQIENKNYFDNINGRVLKDAFQNENFAIALTQLINLSLTEGIVPDDWKVSTIIPIPKNNNPILDEEYRPINMLPVYEKILELVVQTQILKHISANEILIAEQSGFRKNHSCESSLNFVLNSWKKDLEDGKVIVSVFLDFKRAFETINRKILLKKLQKYGFSGNIIKWFDSYLKNRTQQTKINEFTSSKKENNTGVPQGSVLGPLLFIIYINDIKNCIGNSKINLFADDTLLYVSAKNADEAINKINEDLKHLLKWLNENQLKLNISKTKAMIISNKTNIEKSLHILLGDEKIDFVEEMKYLGIILDNKLNFNAHTEYLRGKIIKKYHVMRRIDKKTTAYSQILLYKSLIAPHFEYCSSILFLLNKNQLNTLQKLQNKIMRLILKVKYDTSIKFMLDCLQWMSVEQRIIFNTLKFIWKMEQKLLPDYMCTNLIQRQDVRNYNLRNNTEYNIPHFTKSSSHNSLFYKGIDLYNKFKKQFPRNNKLCDFNRNCIKFVKLEFKLN